MLVLQMDLCQLTQAGFLKLVKSEVHSGKGLIDSYNSVEEFHKEQFGKNRYSGWHTFQRIWYSKKKTKGNSVKVRNMLV